MIQRTKCELISRVHRRKATILPTSRKWMISQGKRDGWILSRMRLLADDIVSFSIPLPFFTHLLISLSRRFEIRGTKMREKERERGLRERFEDLSSTPNLPPFPRLFHPLVFQRLLVIFLLFVPGERRSLWDEKEREGEVDLAIRSFVSSKRVRVVFLPVLFSKCFSPP